MDPNPLEIEVKRALCKRAAKAVLLIDVEKLGRPSTLTVLGLEAVDEVVSDAKPARALSAALREAGVKVRVG